MSGSGIEGFVPVQETPYPITRRVFEVNDARGANVSAGTVFYLPYPLSYDTGYGMILDVKYDGVSGPFTELNRLTGLLEESPDTTSATWSRTIVRGDVTPRLVTATVEQRILNYMPENAVVAFTFTTDPISGVVSKNEGFDGAQDLSIAGWREHFNGYRNPPSKDFTGSSSVLTYLSAINTILLPQIATEDVTRYAYEIWRKRKYKRKAAGPEAGIGGSWALYRRTVDCTNRTITLANLNRGFPTSGLHAFKWCLFDKATGARSPLSSEIYTSGKLGAKKR